MARMVDVEDMSHVYVTDKGASLAVAGIHLSVEPGEFVSLVGPSGCGKTTILSVIAGLIQPTSGTVRIRGKPVNGPSAHVGYMLQQDYLFPWLTIWENAMTGLEIKKQVTSGSQAYVRQLLDQMGLAGAVNQYPSQLSGGMRQRAALVRTLAAKPDLLLLDEPFSALDYQTKLTLEDLVLETLRSEGKTAILVTHDLSEAIAMSDRVIVLGRNPGHIRRELHVPEPIRRALPLQAREEPGFHRLFRELWRELQETEGGEVDAEAEGR
ncbi:ABC transporter ATP-binding protein [Insulibacter thermoxylanivorax]|uniref:ABC transporter ATP-binding protein n=1 Tax=Insulibacter thermoxylanivorax TaxID=2749268 RepID=A0A916VF84_9BACL|nr:ABC transporter ATP-binding protein [Insulibacter thermoxylanivorax]GFR37101.1 ABC transporter ATP-binding protein [Insulibacter thermoxylanivorax]